MLFFSIYSTSFPVAINSSTSAESATPACLANSSLILALATMRCECEGDGDREVAGSASRGRGHAEQDGRSLQQRGCMGAGWADMPREDASSKIGKGVREHPRWKRQCWKRSDYQPPHLQEAAGMVFHWRLEGYLPTGGLPVSAFESPLNVNSRVRIKLRNRPTTRCVFAAMITSANREATSRIYMGSPMML
jgi:hypothetical protein